MGSPEVKFFDREEEARRLRSILGGVPHLLYFVYGPINTGKTALLIHLLESLPEGYCSFYINFRWRNVRKVEDLIRVLFLVRRQKHAEIKNFLKELIRESSRALRVLKGIPIPEGVFDLLFGDKESVEDIFAFLEDYFTEIEEEGLKPVLFLDEMQTIKDLLNASGRPVLSGLFNFFVGMTKERHLVHILCATSDSLFLEEVYRDAHLEGRAGYLLVDDLSKERALAVYEEFGFREKEDIWCYLGGKLGDMIRLYEKKREGWGEREALRAMLLAERTRLEWVLRRAEERGFAEGVGRALEVLRREGKKRYMELPDREVRFLVEENVLFYDPVEGMVRPQGRLIERAMEEFGVGGA